MPVQRVLIVSHTFVKGAAQELEEYLLRNEIESLTFIGHPLEIAPQQRSFIKTHRHGKLIEHRTSAVWKYGAILGYFKDLWFTLIWTLKSGQRYDLLVGVNNLNALACLILRALGRGKKVAYYTIDYVPKRFSNRLLNSIYHALDTFCVRYVDTVWNVSPRMLEIGAVRGLAQYREKQIQVPIGINIKRLGPLNLTSTGCRRVLFIGHIIEKQGAQLVVEAAPAVIKAVPDVRFKIVGDGDYRAHVERMVTERGLSDYFEFTGLIIDRARLDDELRQGGIGVAPYVPTPDNFTYFSDPTKPKDYMAFGLPVVITDVPHIASEIEKRGAGFMIQYDARQLADKLVSLLSDVEMYECCRAAALMFAAEFDWDEIFGRMLSPVAECDGKLGQLN